MKALSESCKRHLKAFERVSGKGSKKLSWQGFWDDQDFTELKWSGRALVLWGWIGLDWTGVIWGGMYWTGLHWARLDETTVYWTGVNRIESWLGRTRVDWAGLGWTVLDYGGLE